MSTIIVQGGKPLIGTVKVSGSVNTTLKLIYASMFSIEDVYLENVPHVKHVQDVLDIVESIGGRYEWLGLSKLRLNGSGINTNELSMEIGVLSETSLLLSAVLLYKFGKATLPLPTDIQTDATTISSFLEIWQSLSYKVEIIDNTILITSSSAHLTGTQTINLGANSHIATDTAILCSLFAHGDVVIQNAAQEPEVDSLIDFCNSIGAQVTREDATKISVKGTSVFRATTFRLGPDKDEVVTFAVAALVTGGNITISNIERTELLSFVNVLSKMGCKFEFVGKELRIWHAGETFQPVTVLTSAYPGFLSTWQPLVTLLLTQSPGASLVYDTVYTDRFDYIKDLNRMGAKIKLLTPSMAKLDQISVPSDSVTKSIQEPQNVAEIIGPTKLKGARLIISNLKYGAVLALAALAAEGKSEIAGYEHIDRYFENFTEKILGLGASIEVV